jgi:hypothetical protein
MDLKKLAPLIDPFYVTSQCRSLSNHNCQGHLAQVLKVANDGDDAPISLLW